MEELNTSKLGTKDYWDHIYDVEVGNFLDHGEKGEVWFGEDSVVKMVDWMEDNVAVDLSVIDLGCGNGHLVFELFDLGFTQLLGVDYSEKAVELAKHIAASEDKQVEFETMDILNQEPTTTYDVAVDKGTFDAISLGAFEPGTTAPATIYVEKVHKMLKDNGILLITSCNWTEPELLLRFKDKFEFMDRVKYPTFKFGGVQGQTITTIAFKKI
ncbi:S-adenosyl-L-methionine-dependent methyltransferase [Gorgonomyces haynaldii]|nr:S-adenosyl-L-methionine-dependent methyltransferase [Gorgonomyces haynaldii]